VLGTSTPGMAARTPLPFSTTETIIFVRVEAVSGEVACDSSTGSGVDSMMSRLALRTESMR